MSISSQDTKKWIEVWSILFVNSISGYKEVDRSAQYILFVNSISGYEEVDRSAEYGARYAGCT